MNLSTTIGVTVVAEAKEYWGVLWRLPAQNAEWITSDGIRQETILGTKFCVCYRSKGWIGHKRPEKLEEFKPGVDAEKS